MAGASITDATAAAGARFGRYFELVTAVPSALFVFFVYVLVASGAWTGAPDMRAVVDNLSALGIGGLSLLAILSLAFGLFMHPLQFALTQVLEGYWGTSLIARSLASRRIRRRRAHARSLRRYRNAQGNVADKARAALGRGMSFEMGDPYVAAFVDEGEFARAVAAYPVDVERILPTRLGNVLRRYEDLAGRQYGLDAVAIAPHLALTAQPEHLASLRDARRQLDLAVRMCVLSMMAFVVSFGFLISDGTWLLVATIPYGLAYIAYRGAVVGAAEYGTVLATVIDLDRFRLYAHLHVPAPPDSQKERQTNVRVQVPGRLGSGFRRRAGCRVAGWGSAGR